MLRPNIEEVAETLAAVTRDQDAVERGKKVGLEEVVRTRDQDAVERGKKVGLEEVVRGDYQCCDRISKK